MTTFDGAPLLGEPEQKVSYRMPMLSTLFSGMQYSLVMPTIWEYMREDSHSDSKPSLGLLVAVFTLCQALFFPLMGRWSDRAGFRVPYCTCAVAGIMGGCLYALAGWMHSLPLAFAGRALLGVGGANRTLCSGFIKGTAGALSCPVVVFHEPRGERFGRFWTPNLLWWFKCCSRLIFGNHPRSIALTAILAPRSNFIIELLRNVRITNMIKRI